MIHYEFYIEIFDSGGWHIQIRNANGEHESALIVQFESCFLRCIFYLGAHRCCDDLSSNSRKTHVVEKDDKDCDDDEWDESTSKSAVLGLALVPEELIGWKQVQFTHQGVQRFEKLNHSLELFELIIEFELISFNNS